MTAGIEMLSLSLKAFGDDSVFNPTIIWDEVSAVLIDTGLPGQIDEIKKEMDRIGVPFDKLSAIIMTHQDIDHIGNIDKIQSELNIDVYSHEFDKPYIDGSLPLMKTDPSNMPEEEWEALPAPVKHLYATPPNAAEVIALKDRDILPFCGGIEVIHTPGHTPGHISLFHKKSGTLIAGDAMISINGMLRRPIAHVTPDIKEAVKSLARFLEYDVKQVICFHGGLASAEVNKQLNNLVDEGMEAVFKMQ